MNKKIIESILSTANDRNRIVVAIAGPPGAGKSTLAESVFSALSADADNPPAAVVPMDGFHLDNEILKERGLYARKGAINTFDGEGFVKLVSAIRENHCDLPIPGFDRAGDCVVEHQFTLKQETRIVLLEGNYLLIDQAPWDRLAPLYDLTIFTSPGIETLRERLIQRWLDHGLPQDQAIKRANENDIINAQFVLDHSRTADILVS